MRDERNDRKYDKSDKYECDQQNEKQKRRQERQRFKLSDKNKLRATENKTACDNSSASARIKKRGTL